MAIIQCPYCGNKISSYAMTCPHCNQFLKDQSSADINNNTPIQSSQIDEKNESANNPFTPKNQPEKKRSSGCLYIFIGLIIGIFCFAFAIVGIKFYNEQQQAKREQIRLELAQRILEDEKANKARLLQMQMDSALWKKTFNAKTLEATEEYINMYPEGIFINEAYMLQEELNRRNVSPQEAKIISNIVNAKIEEYQQLKVKNKENDVLGLHFSIDEELNIKKKYVNRDSFHYVVTAILKETINRTDPKKPHSNSIKIELILNAEKKILKSNL